MEKVVNVSLSGIAFTLDEKANTLFRDYLNQFENHYKNNPNGPEIIEGIESRMAELLSERGGRNGVVSAKMAQEVINTIGRPEEVFDEPESPDNKSKAEAKPRKRLFRDTNSKIILGVCSGLAAYFSTDPVWFRIGFTAITVLSAVTASSRFWNPGAPVVLYLLLALCIPAAATAAERCEMRGVSSSYEEIQKQVENKKESSSIRRDMHDIFSFLGRCFLIFIGLLLTLIGFAGIVALAAALFGVAVAGLAIPEVLSSLLASVASVPGWVGPLFKVLVVLAVFLPFVGMLYGGIMLLFKIKSPKWKPGLIIFLVWVFSLIGLAGIVVRCSLKLKDITNARNTEVVENCTDRLHIELVDVDKWKEKTVMAHGDRHSYNLAYLDLEDRDNASLAVYPKIFLRDGNSAEVSVRTASSYLSHRLKTDDFSSSLKPSFCKVSNDTLFLSPIVFSKESPIREFEPEVRIFLPENVSLQIDGPISHSFENTFSFTDIDNPLLKKLLDL